jgi:hypothetical protein
MDRDHALAWLAGERHEIPSDQEFVAGFFEPADAPGIARLFYTVYGDGYPIDTFYIPERLIEQNRSGDLRSVVARTPRGDVVAHVALFRSSAPNPHLYESGLGLTLPAYRSTMAFLKANQLVTQLVGAEGIDGFFGEAVCNHVITQKLCKFTRAKETALEPALMPARAYEAEQSAKGRVGCIVYTRVVRDKLRKLYIPNCYRSELDFLLNDLNLDRELLSSNAGLPQADGTFQVTRFDFAQVARCVVTEPGTGLAAQLTDLEQKLRQEGFALIQVYVNLGQPLSNAMVDLLHEQGYRLGGLLPIWFGDDGLLLQKHFVDPDLDGMKILSDRGRQLVAFVRQDMGR